MECRAADSASSSSFGEYNRFSVMADNGCENDDVIDVIGATISRAKKEKKQKEQHHNCIQHESADEKDKTITNDKIIKYTKRSKRIN